MKRKRLPRTKQRSKAYRNVDIFYQEIPANLAVCNIKDKTLKINPIY